MLMGVLVDGIGARPTVAAAAVAMLAVAGVVAVRGRFETLDEAGPKARPEMHAERAP
jgi:hypothetical protein